MQGTYPFVWDFVKRLRHAEGTPAFFADTLLGYSGGILLPMKRFLRAAGYRPIGAKEFLMPSNIFLRTGMTREKRSKIDQTLAKAEDFADALLDGNSRWLDVPIFADLMSSISRCSANWAFFRRITPLRIDMDRCTSCGLCVRLCPVSTITMTEAGPAGGDTCVFCARCFSYCPRGAISFDHYRSARYRAVSVSDLLSG
jgi:NAD-dependent dihydropyrimidine dehydrogenase PreA subunit